MVTYGNNVIVNNRRIVTQCHNTSITAGQSLVVRIILSKARSQETSSIICKNPNSPFFSPRESSRDALSGQVRSISTGLCQNRTARMPNAVPFPFSGRTIYTWPTMTWCRRNALRLSYRLLTRPADRTCTSRQPEPRTTPDVPFGVSTHVPGPATRHGTPPGIARTPSALHWLWKPSRHMARTNDLCPRKGHSDGN